MGATDARFEEIVQVYRQVVGVLPGVKQAWARTDGEVVRFTTLITPGDAAERAVYDAELRVSNLVGAEYVAFEVYRDRKSIPMRTAEAITVLQPA